MRLQTGVAVVLAFARTLRRHVYHVTGGQAVPRQAMLHRGSLFFQRVRRLASTERDALSP